MKTGFELTLILSLSDTSIQKARKLSQHLTTQLAFPSMNILGVSNASYEPSYVSRTMEAVF